MRGASSSDQSRAKPWYSRHAGALFVGGFGLVFGVVGVLILLLGVSGVLEHARVVRGLPTVTPQTITRFAPDTHVLAEGRIAADQPTPHRDFVAGTRQEFRGWKADGARRREEWTTLEVFSPPLAVAMEGGAIRGINNDYEMRDEPHTWQSTESLTYNLFGTSTQRITGFMRGDVIVMEGVVRSGVEGLAMRATAVIGGDRVGYIESLEQSAVTLRIVGGIFAGVGGLLFLGGLIAVLRSPAAAART